VAYGTNWEKSTLTVANFMAELNDPLELGQRPLPLAENNRRAGPCLPLYLKNLCLLH
jgi:hypothetical protein